MGFFSDSKPAETDPVHLCNERTVCIKKAIDSRLAFSAAHLCYIQSLQKIGAALKQFVEAESSGETLASNFDDKRILSPSSFASQSPPHMLESSPLSPWLSDMDCLGTSVGSAGVRFSSLDLQFHKEASSLPMQISSTWDFFDPNALPVCENIPNGDSCDKCSTTKFVKLISLSRLKESDVVPLIEEHLLKSHRIKDEPVGDDIGQNSHSSDACVTVERFHESKVEGADLQKELCAEREDASEFITHRAKDFLASIKDIEQRFLRAAEAGNHVSEMLETKKNYLGISMVKTGKWPASRVASALCFACCKARSVLHQEPLQPVAEVITWSSTVSFASSPSSCKKHIAFALEDGNGGGVSKSSEEFCMMSGRHSSTLERLYAWEKKLFDEVKVSATIRKEYDQKCRLLANSYARDLKSEAIDRTRALVKDLHSQLLVSIQSVDLISKKIERLRDDELQPQLVELIHGLVLMWKGMLKCHHAQFITISLAYHAKSSIETVNKTSYMQVLMQLYDEVYCFGSSFANWIDAHKRYAESLNGWLQKCILPSHELSVGRKVFVTHCRASSPPIFALFQGWLVGIGSLPLKGLSDAIRSLASVLHDELLNERTMHKDGGEGEGSKLLESRLSIIQTSLKSLFDQLAKVSEAAVKVFERCLKSK